MTRIDFVVRETGRLIFSMQSDIAPNVGDLLSVPDGNIYRVIQRAYIAEVVGNSGQIIDLSKQDTACTIFIHCLVERVEIPEMYDSEVQ